MNIFEKLDLKGIPYAVCVSYSTMKRKTIGWCANEYFLIVKHDAVPKHSMAFLKSNNITNLSERNLSEKEISIFKQKISDFVLKLENKYGKVYEKKSVSFKQYFKLGVLTQSNDAL